MAKGGVVDGQLLAKLSHLGGVDIGGDAGKLRINGRVADNGAVLRPGLNLLDNRTGRLEPMAPLRGGGGTVELGPNTIKALAAELRRNPPQVSVQALSAAQARHNGILGRR
jgi:hypothetical protein